MRRVLFIGLAIFGLFLSAQNEPATVPDSIPVELAKKIFIYNASKQYNDHVVTRMALYNLLAENPNNIALRDSLALLYFQQKQFASAALISQEVANLAPDDMFATEIAATSLERLGAKDRALVFYERLLLNNSSSLNYLYKVAFLQYDLALHEEALVSAQLIQDNEASAESMVIFPTEDEKGQEVSMKIVAVRLMGMVEELRGNKEKAKEYYHAVLKEMPDFEVVKQQLEKLSE